MPDLHGCMKCCEGCELRRCCLPRSPSRHPWPRLKPHLCEHCLTLYDEYVSKLPGSGNEIPLQHIRFQVARILYAHARRMKRDSELSEGTFSTLPDENSSDESPWSDLASSGHWASQEASNCAGTQPLAGNRRVTTLLRDSSGPVVAARVLLQTRK